MKAPQKRSLLGIAAAFGAALIGVVWLNRKQSRQKNQVVYPSPDNIHPPLTHTPEAAPALPQTPHKTPWLILAAAFGGTACLVTAQTLLLNARTPIWPLILYSIGIIALLPTLAYRPIPLNLAWFTPIYEGAAVIGLMGLTGLTHAQIATPQPLLPQPDFTYGIVIDTASDLAALQHFASLCALLLIPGVYLLGRVFDSPLTGLTTAGFASVSLWVLALSKTPAVYMALAALSAFYLLGLCGQRKGFYVVSACAFVAGWLISPLFIYMALLAAVHLLLTPHLHKRNRLLKGLIAAGCVAIVILHLILHFPGRPIPVDYKFWVGTSPLIAIADAFSSALLSFNFTGDPNPLHGVWNRPIFSPLISALFVIGTLALLRQKRWQQTMLLAALAIGVLPSALFIHPPLAYPHIGLMALALPPALLIASYGLRWLLSLLVGNFGARGLWLVFALLLALLLNTAHDTRQHYQNVFLPIYRDAAQAHIILNTD